MRDLPGGVGLLYDVVVVVGTSRRSCCCIVVNCPGSSTKETNRKLRKFS